MISISSTNSISEHVKKRNKEWRGFCRKCGVAQTSTDWQAGFCTNCGAQKHLRLVESKPAKRKEGKRAA